MKKSCVLVTLFVVLMGAVFCVRAQDAEKIVNTSSQQPNNSIWQPGSSKEKIRSTGQLIGSLAGASGGGLEGIPIVVQGRKDVYYLFTDAQGRYRAANLPAGIYEIYPYFPLGDPAYGRFRRARFKVIPGAEKAIDISPYAGFEYCSQKGERLVFLQPTDSGGKKEQKRSALKYESFSVHQEEGEPLELLVDYCQRVEKDGIIDYKSATVTYDEMTLYADKVRLRRKDLLLQTFGERTTLLSHGVVKPVSKFTALFTGKAAFFELTNGFTESVEADVKGDNISFDLDIKRDGRAKLFYTDKARGITLESSDDVLSFITTENPNKIRFSGYGIVSGKGIPPSGHNVGYSNFTVTLEKDNKPHLRVEIPIKGYNETGITLPRGSVHIRREERLEVIADSHFD